MCDKLNTAWLHLERSIEQETIFVRERFLTNLFARVPPAPQGTPPRKRATDFLELLIDQIEPLLSPAAQLCLVPPHPLRRRLMRLFHLSHSSMLTALHVHHEFETFDSPLPSDDRLGSQGMSLSYLWQANTLAVAPALFHTNPLPSLIASAVDSIRQTRAWQHIIIAPLTRAPLTITLRDLTYTTIITMIPPARSPFVQAQEFTLDITQQIGRSTCRESG